jgi:transposase-like protein
MKNQSVSNYAVDEKLAALNRVAQLQADGVPLVEACRQAGVSPASILRWREAYRIGGVVGLKPKAAPGRPSYAELLSEDAMARIRELALKTGSIALAYDIFQADPLCPEEIRDVLSRRRNGDAVPLSLMRAARVTPEVKAMHRGQKTYQLNSFTALRDMTEITPDGARRQIEPGDWWELDDMSLNHPFWYEADCPVCGANGNRDEDCRPIVSPRCSKLAHAHGVEVGRQSLWALDVASCKWLGVEMVGRRQDAYRAEDILRFLR